SRPNQFTPTANLPTVTHPHLPCCNPAPANLPSRQPLRRTKKAKFKHNLRGSRLAFLATSPTRAKLKAARGARDYLKVLEHGEEILTHNPWDVGAQMAMAEAAEALGLLDLAVWTLEQARTKDPKDTTVNRALARMNEKSGNVTQAMKH